MITTIVSVSNSENVCQNKPLKRELFGWVTLFSENIWRWTTEPPCQKSHWTWCFVCVSCIWIKGLDSCHMHYSRCKWHGLWKWTFEERETWEWLTEGMSDAEGCFRDSPSVRDFRLDTLFTLSSFCSFYATHSGVRSHQTSSLRLNLCLTAESHGEFRFTFQIRCKWGLQSADWNELLNKRSRTVGGLTEHNTPSAHVKPNSTCYLLKKKVWPHHTLVAFIRFWIIFVL